MQNEAIVISQNGLTRYDVLRRVLDRTISLMDAAGYLRVSYRHAKRLKSRAEEGLAGMIHGNNGRSPAIHRRCLREASNNKILTRSRQTISGQQDRINTAYGTRSLCLNTEIVRIAPHNHSNIRRYP